MNRIPGEVADDDGKIVRIHRAWPRRGGSLIVEGREIGSDRVRAGRIDAGGRASMVPFAHDPALPALSAEGLSGELLVHRLKRRAVVRSDGQYRKFVAGGKASAVADAHRVAVRALAGSGLEVPDVVASDEYSVTLTAVPGMSLFELGRTSGPANGTIAPGNGGGAGQGALEAWERSWRLWAMRWPEFVGGPGSTDASMAARIHSAADEVRTVERWLELGAFNALGVSERRLRGAAAGVAQSLLAGTSPVRLAHRDLHDKQVLVDPDQGSVGIIDCDTLSVAEPALDLANLSVHLDFRVAQNLLSAGAAALGKQHIRETAQALEIPPARFEAYASATAIRLACIYAFRPPYRTVARTWFNALETRLVAASRAGAASR
ncbi:aminoglycoside phosphotransferase family protein [uncultured Arthrobacter sp.]|uniref:aminoglycoside phosphotransferase family protein n=1 Tax=uncultured Arthrobacter sp. TaxID=114050 RepID=UPI0026248FB2|nr:aminoglycoside phosphotransferase family protein [uncultured Arthrobacter sp.]